MSSLLWLAVVPVVLLTGQGMTYRVLVTVAALHSMLIVGMILEGRWLAKHASRTPVSTD